MPAKDTEKFITHYQKLQTIAQQLKDNNPDIDKVISQVKEAVESYKICKQRLDSATQELEKIMQDVDSGSVEIPPRAVGTDEPVEAA